MISTYTLENINIKIEQAYENAKKALELCGNYAVAQDPKDLKRLGGYLGNYVNNLRSALNYATTDYSNQRNFRDKKGKPLRNTDFPYSFVEDDFKSLPLVSLMSKTDPELYDFIEEIQPYHHYKSSSFKTGAFIATNNQILMTGMDDNKSDSPKFTNWLGNIMQISNMDKHNLLVHPQEMNINTFAILDENFFQPKHMGVAVMVGEKNGEPIFVKTPCYVPQVRMFALKDLKWLNFMIPMDGGFLEFIPFMQGTAKGVADKLNKFSSLWS
ncbi:MAG: hypothetical protein JNM55_09290 [Anaerolineales bacterium]|nr:hypothetical protein [Anaerolineales bacterium]